MQYDVIVVGVGSMGSSTCYHLAEKKAKVLGLEQFDITHERGSHSGQSRLIRKAYFENPRYVPLLNHAYKGWEEIQRLSGTQLYWPTGILYFGDENDAIIHGIENSASIHGLQLDHIPVDQALNKWPQFNLPSNYRCVFEPEAGFITPEPAIKTYVEAAKNLGAHIHEHEKVESWYTTSDGVKVITNHNQYKARKLVLTTGAYTNDIIANFPINLEVTKQYIGWVRPQQASWYELGQLPCWMISRPNSTDPYYGFPAMPFARGPERMKVAHHKMGSSADKPERITEEEKNLNGFILDHLNGVEHPVQETKSCKYTYSSDHDFIVDLLPEYDKKVIIGCGFSGHGFKFVPVIGKALAQLALDSTTELPIEFLRLSRFSN